MRNTEERKDPFMIRTFPTISTEARNHVLIRVNTYRRTDGLAQTDSAQEISKFQCP